MPNTQKELNSIKPIVTDTVRVPLNIDCDIKKLDEYHEEKYSIMLSVYRHHFEAKRRGITSPTASLQLEYDGALRRTKTYKENSKAYTENMLGGVYFTDGKTYLAWDNGKLIPYKNLNEVKLNFFKLEDLRQWMGQIFQSAYVRKMFPYYVQMVHPSVRIKNPTKSDKVLKY